MKNHHDFPCRFRPQPGNLIRILFLPDAVPESGRRVILAKNQMTLHGQFPVNAPVKSFFCQKIQLIVRYSGWCILQPLFPIHGGKKKQGSRHPVIQRKTEIFPDVMYPVSTAANPDHDPSAGVKD
jgi:hypothetical protein